MATQRTFELMTAIADRFEQDIEAIADEADAVVIGGMPEFGADPAITAEVCSSNRANLRRFLAVARRAEDPPPIDIPPEALDIARTMVRRGIPSDAIYQGYRRAQQIAWRRWMQLAEEVVAPADDVIAVLDESLRILFDYVDRVLAAVIAAMQREREEVLGGALARRTETVRLILDGAPLDPDNASRRLRYDLARRHTAAVVWAEPQGPQQGALEPTALALAQAVGTSQPLTVPAGATILWAWISSDADVSMRDLRAAMVEAPPGLRVAVGPTCPGIAGFRRSHEAASGVYRLIAGNPDGNRFATFEDLEITALAGHDERRAAEFIATTLGPLAADTPTATRLRETLRVFLEEAEHAPRTAARLHTHRNTVLQRVARATDLLGYRPGERRLAVALALELRRRLGPRMA